MVHPTWERTRPDDPNDGHTGWVFRSPDDPPISNPAGKGCFSCVGCIPDPHNAAKSVRDLYELAGCPPNTKYTVPVLWDTKMKTIVNNEVRSQGMLSLCSPGPPRSSQAAGHSFLPLLLLCVPIDSRQRFSECSTPASITWPRTLTWTSIQKTFVKPSMKRMNGRTSRSITASIAVDSHRYVCMYVYVGY